jgi:hypothetical protein
MADILYNTYMIKDVDISFVIQGAYSPATDKSIKNIRRLFPKASIIFSTTSTIPKKIDVDLIVQRPDPGAIRNFTDPRMRLQNINRQIASTVAGLRAAKTKYAFKLRSDFIITGCEFLEYWDKYPIEVLSHKIFLHRVLSLDYYSRDPRRMYPCDCNSCYHPSDAIMFGKTTDILDYYDIPFEREDFVKWDERPQFLRQRYNVEAYICTEWLKKHGRKIFAKKYNNINERAVIDTEKLFAANFIFLEPEQFCVRTKAPHFNRVWSIKSFRFCYTHAEWEGLYQLYADVNFTLPTRDKERELLERIFARWRVIKITANILTLPLFFSRNLRHKAKCGIFNFILYVLKT